MKSRALSRGKFLGSTLVVTWGYYSYLHFGVNVELLQDRLYVSQGMLYPLLPYGDSSPTRNKGQSSYHTELTFVLLKKVLFSH